MTNDNSTNPHQPPRRARRRRWPAPALLAMPSVLRAQDKSLKVGVYGGYFKDSFDKHIFPEFTKATGIAVESVAEPTGEAWLVQLEQAAKAGQAPGRRLDDVAGRRR